LSTPTSAYEADADFVKSTQNIPRHSAAHVRFLCKADVDRAPSR
jgi:hypothetical protein